MVFFFLFKVYVDENIVGSYGLIRNFFDWKTISSGIEKLLLSSRSVGDQRFSRRKQTMSDSGGG